MDAYTDALKEQMELLQDDSDAFRTAILEPLYADGRLDALLNLIAYPGAKDEALDHALTIRKIIRDSVRREADRIVSGLPRHLMRAA